MFPIRPNNNPVQAYHRAILFQSREISEFLETAGEAPDLAVHEIRKNIKGIRAVLRAARGMLDPEAYKTANYAYRDLGRCFSELRDDAVLIETFSAVVLSAEYLPEDAEALRQQLFGGFPDEASRRSWFTSEQVVRLRKQLESAVDMIRRLDFESEDHATQAAGVLRTHARAAAGYRAAYREPESPHKFHEWRKQVKYLWHQVLLFAGENEREYPLVADLKHLSDLLGLAHDASELELWLQDFAGADPEGHVANLKEDIRRFRIDHEGAARPHGRALFNGAAGELVRRLTAPCP